MKKLTGIFALLAVALLATGCAGTAKANIWKAAAAASARVHELETPYITADFESNPIRVQAGLGVVTIGAEAGIGDNDDLVSADLKVNLTEDNGG